MRNNLTLMTSDLDCSRNLQDLMLIAGIPNFKSLSRISGVSERQIMRLRRGKIGQMRVEVLLKLSQVLQISLSELVATFLISSPGDNTELDLDSISCRALEKTVDTPEATSDTHHKHQDSGIDYQKWEQQRELLWLEFQQSSLQLLESLLLQWPTAAHKAQENPQLAAIKILPLIQKPLEKLLQAWGVQAIASVGVEVPYDPQLHQLIDEGNVQPGETVKVRYTGYFQGDKLLYRAQVSRV